MTVETQDNRIVYPADGVTEDFAFNFKTDDVETIKVYVDAIISLATIVVTLNPDQELIPGGSVNITPAPIAPDIVTITREEDFFQLTKYPVGGDFPSASHEAALDKVAKLTQQIDDKFVRSIRADINEPLTGVSLVIPNATDRQSTFLGFDSLGNAIVSPGGPGTVPVSSFMTPVLSAADGDAARLLLESMAGFKYIQVAGTDNYTSVNTPNPHTNYRTNIVYFGNFVNANITTTPTWNIDGIGIRNIVSKNGGALLPGELSGDHLLVYVGGVFRLLNPSPAQGVWTPNLWDFSLSSAEGQLYTKQAGTYVRIGNEVFFRGYLDITNIGTLTGSDPAFIGPLPFAAINNADYVGAGDVFRGLGLSITAGNRMSGQVLFNNNYMELMLWSSTSGVSAATVNNITGSGEIAFSGQYTAA